jgi:hypothetical protein
VLVLVGVVMAIQSSGGSRIMNPEQEVDISGSWPTPRLLPRLGGADTVTLHIAGVVDNNTREAISDRLAALMAGTSYTMSATSAGDRTSYLVAPIMDPQAFAKRIDFGTVRRVDGLTITIVARKVEGPPENADAVTKAKYNLLSPNTNRRDDAIRQLKGMVPDRPREDVTRALLPLMDDPLAITRVMVIEALLVWGTPEAVPKLLKAMEAPETRHAAIRALGRIKDERAIEPLARRLEFLEERGPVMEALKAFGQAAEPAVIKRLGNPNGPACVPACEILEVIGTKASLPALNKVAAVREFIVANAAKKAIQAISKRQ